MKFTSLKVFIPALCALLVLSSCNFPSPASPTPGGLNLQETAVAGTISALGTAAVLTAAPGAETPSPGVIASQTNTSAPVAGTPQNPLVVKDALCWKGPGVQYEVVSAVRNGERVELLGRGSVGSWWIINNPIYHDPCWVTADVLQFDTGYNLSGIAIFTPPPTPTLTPTMTLTPTFTVTP
jgi:hypothetical protein